MKRRFNLFIVILSILVSACTNLSALKRTKIEGNNFNAELARDYLYFADSEAKQYDWLDSEHFAKKGLAAAKNRHVLPEDVNQWAIKKEHKHELLRARQQLDEALTDHNKTSFPKEAAGAQYFYDCWVEQQEENWQEEDIMYCKSHFFAALKKLHGLIDTHPKVHIENLQKQNHYVVFFDFDKANIDQAASGIIDDASEAIKENNSDVTLSGYADNTGPDAYNDRLSLRRANAVKENLLRLGIGKDKIKVKYYGRHHLAVPTPYGVKERKNRRVEIDLSK